MAKAHATLGWILHWQNHSKEGTEEFERAFEFNPNFVDGRFGALLTLSGRAPEAIEYLQRIMRLDPFYSPLCCPYRKPKTVSRRGVPTPIGTITH